MLVYKFLGDWAAELLECSPKQEKFICDGTVTIHSLKIQTNHKTCELPTKDCACEPYIKIEI